MSISTAGYALLVINAATAVSFVPVSFEVSVSGTVNGQAINYGGTGVVDPLGIYTGTLTFDNLPVGFHPIAASAYTMSICCAAEAEVRHGAVNMDMLLDPLAYSSTRTLTFPGDHTLVIDGNVAMGGDGVIRFTGSINGTVDLPPDVEGRGTYFETMTPVGAGSVTSEGAGQISRAAGGPIPVTVATEYNFDNSVTMPTVQYRTVIDSGSLDGLAYHVTLHSILDTIPPAEIPTMGSWGLVITGILLTVVAVVVYRLQYNRPRASSSG